jgi:hypothetical protein
MSNDEGKCYSESGCCVNSGLCQAADKCIRSPQDNVVQGNVVPITKNKKMQTISFEEEMKRWESATVAELRDNPTTMAKFLKEKLTKAEFLTLQGIMDSDDLRLFDAMSDLAVVMAPELFVETDDFDLDGEVDLGSIENDEEAE